MRPFAGAQDDSASGLRIGASGPDPPAFATVRPGAPYVALLAGAAVPLWRWRRRAGAAAVAAAGACALFFRDPVRPRPAEPALVYAPSARVVVGVERVEQA